MTEGIENPLMILWGGKTGFVVVFNLQMWFPFTPGFSSSAPICVCGYQPKCGSRALGGAVLPCLMAPKGLCSAKFMVTTLFLLRASCRLLCWGDAAPDMRLFSCFGAAIVPGGYSCCWGPWGVHWQGVQSSFSLDAHSFPHPLLGSPHFCYRQPKEKSLYFPARYCKHK